MKYDNIGGTTDSIVLFLDTLLTFHSLVKGQLDLFNLYKYFNLNGKWVCVQVE